MTLRFRKNLEDLLDDWCPPQGMTALLLEHATGGVYFPLVVKPFSVATDYYSLPLRFTPACPRVVSLDETSSPDLLAYRGRLELTQPDLRWPVNQEILPLHEDGDGALRVLLLRSGPGALPPIDDRSLGALRHLVPMTCSNWMDHAQNLVEVPDVHDLESLARDLVRRLSDETQDPPYFPILHAEVWPDPDGSVGRFSSVNLLSWNCFLVDNGGEMPPYIPEMPRVMRERQALQWWDDVTRRPDFATMPDFLRSACAKTIDQVHVLGHCHHQGRSWWAFARHDKDRRKMAGLLAEWSGTGPIMSVPDKSAGVGEVSAGDLVRQALAVKPAADDVLMTIWLVSEAGEGLNIGFRAGRHIEVLDHAEISDRHPIDIRDCAPFRVRLSPLPRVDRQLIEARVRPVLESAARAARQIDGSGTIDRTFEPVRQELHRGAWHQDYPGGGLFPDGHHDVADWSESTFRTCHPRMVALLDRLLRNWTGDDKSSHLGDCDSLRHCWHIRALKALAHERLHASLLLAVLGGPMDDPSFLAADREICFQEEILWTEVVAALQTVTREGNRFQFQQCFHGSSQTLILRFSGELNDKGVAAALTGQGAQKRKGSFTRACETLRRAARRFGVEVTHDEPDEGRWGIVVVFAERELAC